METCLSDPSIETAQVSDMARSVMPARHGREPGLNHRRAQW